MFDFSSLPPCDHGRASVAGPAFQYVAVKSVKPALGFSAVGIACEGAIFIT
jgi:hypothetical protein